jgi:hypothetical protein
MHSTLHMHTGNDDLTILWFPDRRSEDDAIVANTTQRLIPTLFAELVEDN